MWVSAVVLRDSAADSIASASRSFIVCEALFVYPSWLSGVGKPFPGCVVSPRSAATVLLYSSGLSKRTRAGMRALLVLCAPPVALACVEDPTPFPDDPSVPSPPEIVPTHAERTAATPTPARRSSVAACWRWPEMGLFDIRAASLCTAIGAQITPPGADASGVVVPWITWPAPTSKARLGPKLQTTRPSFLAHANQACALELARIWQDSRRLE